MITLCNREQLITVFTIKEQAELRERLAVNPIDYVMKIVDQLKSAVFGTSRNRWAIGMGRNQLYEYRFYARKEDAELAHSALRKQFRR